MSMHSCIRMYTSYNLIKLKSPHDRTVKLLIAVKDDELLQRLPLLQTGVVSAATGIHVHAESMVAGAWNCPSLAWSKTILPTIRTPLPKL